MDKRTILAIILSIAVLTVYQMFFMKTPEPQTPVPEQKESGISIPTTGAPAAPGEGKRVDGTPLPKEAAAKAREVRVETPLYTAVFTDRGAALKSFMLKSYHKSLPKERNYSLPDILGLLTGKGSAPVRVEDGRPVELVTVAEGMPLPLAVSFPESSIDVPADAAYQTRADFLDLTKTAESGRITFVVTYPGRVTIEKIYTFHPSRYTFDLDVRLTNHAGVPLNENGGLSWHEYVDPKSEKNKDGHAGPVTYAAKSIERQDVDKLSDPKSLGPGVSWSGFENKYFISALIPQSPSLTSVSLARDSRHVVSVRLIGPRNLIPPGQTGSFAYSLFLGPKDYTILDTVGVGLENAIDFGSWIKWLAMPLLVVLNFLYGYVHNYGVAIIVLTTLIKILFWPLGNKSYKSMKELQKLQPKLQTLRERYKDDRTKLGQETMALYKAHHVNPMGGCLPMLIQIPVFFGLYSTLMYAIELRHAPFVWWIQDLSAKDPYYITPLIMGATMFVQQKMSPPMGDPMQAKVMLWMPVIFTFLFLNFSSGLVIYWLFNNILSIGQQYYINKRSS
jgi:YidC/Oxa1 family membrane protein insertase